MVPGKNVGIETIRGIAVILMVAGHVVGSTSENAMQVPDSSPWRFVFTGFEDIRMPLFTVVSGFLYAFRPVTTSLGLRGLVAAKIRRLLIPLAVVGTLLFWTKLITPGTNSKPQLADWWRPYLLGMDHLWFLQAIFLIFLVVGVLDLVGAMTTAKRWTIITMVAAAIYVLVDIPAVVEVFSISGTQRLLPFFLLGYGFRRYGFQDVRRAVVLVVAAIFVIAYSLRLATLFRGIELDTHSDRLLAVTVGGPAVALFFWARDRVANHFLAWIGGFSFGIYLLHYFAYSGARIGLRALGVDSDAVMFVVGVTCGVGLPILFQLVAGRNRWVRFLVLGEKLSATRADQERTALRP